MTEDSAIKAAIKTSIQAIKQRAQFNVSLEQRIRMYNQRSGKIGNAFRRKIVEKAFALGGVEAAEVKRLQSRNDSSDVRFLSSLAAGINKNSKEIRKRQDTIAKNTFRTHNGGPESAAVADILTTAYQIDFLDDGYSSVDSSIAPWQNFARVLMNEYPASLGGYSNSTYAYISFAWKAPRAGTLKATAVVSLNGSYNYHFHHVCPGYSSGGELTESGAIVMTPYTVSEPVYAVPDPNNFLNISDVQTSCGTSVHSGVVDDVRILPYQGLTSFPVQAGETVIITVTCAFYLWLSEASGTIDFMNAAKGVNVVGLIVSLD